MKNIIIASTSTIHGGNYLDYLFPDLQRLFAGVSEIIFIPYARPGGISHENYTDIVRSAFARSNLAVRGIHEYENVENAIQNAEGIFVGGGNTFLLVAQLYKYNLMTALANVVQGGIPYLGTSAGSNIAGLTMQTTNDMPIVYPPSFQTLGLLPFNINPHYLDPIPNSKHMGETRETRIKEFHKFNSIPVIGLREGSWLQVSDNSIILKGGLSARMFTQNEAPVEIDSESDLSFVGK